MNRETKEILNNRDAVKAIEEGLADLRNDNLVDMDDDDTEGGE